MRGAAVKSDVRQSCHVHARLLDGFIGLTRAELDRDHPPFVRESLLEMLEVLRSERRSYGTVGGVVTVGTPAIEDAA